MIINSFVCVRWKHVWKLIECFKRRYKTLKDVTFTFAAENSTKQVILERLSVTKVLVFLKKKKILFPDYSEQGKINIIVMNEFLANG